MSSITVLDVARSSKTEFSMLPLSTRHWNQMILDLIILNKKRFPINLGVSFGQQEYLPQTCLKYKFSLINFNYVHTYLKSDL
jgi:hypothetical protein